MAVVATLETNLESTTDATSYATSSVTVAANEIILVAVMANTTVGAPSSVTGLSLTWNSVISDASISDRSVYLYRAQATGAASGAITAAFGGTATWCAIWVVSCAGAALGSNGANAIETSVAAGLGSAATTFDLDTSGATAGIAIGFATHQTTNSITAGTTSYTSVSLGTPTGRVGGGYDDVTPDAITILSSGAREWAAVAVRVVEPTGSPTYPTVNVHLSGTMVEKPLKTRVSSAWV